MVKRAESVAERSVRGLFCQVGPRAFDAEGVADTVIELTATMGW